MPLFKPTGNPECPVCSKVFGSEQGLSSHLSTARSCRWWSGEPLPQTTSILPQFTVQQVTPPSPDPPSFSWDDVIWPSLDHDGDDCEELERDELELLRPPSPSSKVPPRQDRRPQRALSRALMMDEDAQYVEQHPTAGRVIESRMDVDGENAESLYRPFRNEVDWRIAEWAIKDSIGHSSLDRLFSIPEVVDKLDLSYHNTRALHQKVDSLSDRAGEWKTTHLNFNDDPNAKFTIRHRDPVEAIKSLWKDPALAEHLVYAPSKVYTDKTKTCRSYSEMWTGQWWNTIQSKVPAFATVAPVIIATDKTQLTQFLGGKSAYPVYLTIGNIPKGIRRKPSMNASVLIAYLPVEKMDRTKMTQAEHRSRVQRLFHEAMSVILKPLKQAGVDGVHMESSNGDVRQVHPILSCYVADYPEQCLVTCTKYGTCFKCRCDANDLASSKPSEPRSQSWTTSIQKKAKKESKGRVNRFHLIAMQHGVSGNVYDPFWKDFPYTDIHRIMTPDVLHQLYQGIFKHLVGWCQSIVGEKELDQRIQSLPYTQGLRHFKTGISNMSQISGSERKDMAKVLLGCLVGIMAPGGIKAVKGLLDFIYLAQYPQHDTETLKYLQSALDLFHRNKKYFIDVSCHPSLNIPKLHSLLHYIECIKLFGTTDNYNTELFERLHIDFAKEGWRASNHRDEFPQMIQWLSRQEKMTSLRQRIEAHLSKSSPSSVQLTQRAPFPHALSRPISIAKQSRLSNRSIQSIEIAHNAPAFGHHLKRYLASFLNTSIPDRQLTEAVLPIDAVDLYTSFRFVTDQLNEDNEVADIVKAIPISPSYPSGRFDTVVVMDSDEAEATALSGTRIGRVRVIFRLPKSIQRPGFSMPLPAYLPQSPLAYVEWYTRQGQAANSTHGMYTISRAYDINGRPQGGIIPLSSIRQSCMLIPVFPKPSEEYCWTADNVLDKADRFIINNWSSKYAYQTIY